MGLELSFKNMQQISYRRDKRKIRLLLNQTWVHWPSKESRHLMLKRHKIPGGFQRNIFKDGKDGLGSHVVCDQPINLLLIGGVVTE